MRSTLRESLPQCDADGKIEIIDGQQRLVTFQVFLCAIRDTFIGFDKSAEVNRVNRLIRNGGAPLETVDQYKLLPIADGADKETLTAIVSNTKVPSGLIHDAYIYFRDEIRGRMRVGTQLASNDYLKPSYLILTCFISTILRRPGRRRYLNRLMVEVSYWLNSIISETICF